MVNEATNEHYGIQEVMTVTVAPALPVRGHRRLPMSNLDLLVPPLDVSVFFCYPDPAPTAAALKEALAKTLVAYCPLAGEEVINADGEPELLCNGRGVDFTEASSSGAALRDLQLGLVDEGVQKLMPAKKAGVIAIQVTKFSCGGAVIGCTFNHRVCDAYSFNMFLVASAAAARGGPAPPLTAPSFRRSLVAPRDPPSTDSLTDLLFTPRSAAPPPPAAGAAGSVNRIYRITAADIAALKAAAGSGRTKMEAFTAHLWGLCSRAAASLGQSQCCMGVVVDGRARMSPDGDMGNYFGVMGSEELRCKGLAEVAEDVHRWVAGAATGEHFRGLVDWVEVLRPKTAVVRAYLGGTAGSEAIACIVSSGMGFPVGEADFGSSGVAGRRSRLTISRGPPVPGMLCRCPARAGTATGWCTCTSRRSWPR
ncbi:unnamed protein product [Urochloa humidicola]